jgi:CheY-like chemotaxis protein
MLIILNSKYGVVYGEKQFNEFFGFNVCNILDQINTEKLNSCSNFSDKIYTNNNYFNLSFEYMYNKDNTTEWLINIKEICCNLTQIDFEVNKELNIFNFKVQEELNSNCEDNCKYKLGFEGKNIKFFDNEVYSIIFNHINSKKCSFKNVFLDSDYLLIDTTFCELYNKEYLVYILYNINEDKYKVICKTICEFLKEKIKLKVKSNISNNKNFFYHIFHEIRNYLNIISISSDNLISLIETKFVEIDELLKLENIDIVNSDKKEIIENIDYIKDSSKTIVDIISDVLTLEKLRTNEITIRMSYFMLNDLQQSCVLSMERNAINKDIQFICENNVGSISIKGDYIRIKQVIINLLSNAFKFTNNGGKIIFSINKTQREDKEYIKFSVIDNGVGIKYENHELIFKDFQQIDPEKQQKGGGTGLGLSEYGKGSEFYFEIPFIEMETLFRDNSAGLIKGIGSKSPKKETIETNFNEKSKKIKIPSIMRQNSNKKFTSKIRSIIEDSKQIDFSKIKLLFIDDNRTIQKLFLKILNNLEINDVTIASNGDEGYKVYKSKYENNKNSNSKRIFDIILMDQEMPVMDGNECSRLITELDKNSLIIGLTGNALIEQKDEFIKNGAKEVYEKPITKEKLIELFNKYCKS